MTYPAALAVTGGILFAVALALAAITEAVSWKPTRRRVTVAGWVAFFSAAAVEVAAVWWVAS